MGFLIDFIYIIVSVILSPWILYLLITEKKYREGLLARLGFYGPSELLKESIWLHGSSVGEIMLIKPLVRQLEKELPDTTFIISTFTSTGKLSAKKAYPQHKVIYFPLDLSIIVKIFFRRLSPKVIVIVESEFWPNFILTAHRADIPIIILNGKLSEKSYLAYKKTRIFPWLLKKISLLAVQNEEYANRFRDLGISPKRITITGNMKYDLVDISSENNMRGNIRERFGYRKDDIIFIGGSTHSGEDEALIYAFRKLRNEGHRLELILVPRYPLNVSKVEEIVRGYGFIPLRKTLLDKKRDSLQAIDSNTIFVVDTVGELKIFYSISDIAYVGGSLFFRGSNKGGHNMMEPAIIGVAVIFGPYNFTFKDTVEALMNDGAAIMVYNRENIYEELKKLLLNPQRIRKLGEKAREVILKKRGSTQKNFELLSSFLHNR